jgi:hypothetical protein
MLHVIDPETAAAVDELLATPNWGAALLVLERRSELLLVPRVEALLLDLAGRDRLSADNKKLVRLLVRCRQVGVQAGINEFLRAYAFPLPPDHPFYDLPAHEQDRLIEVLAAVTSKEERARVVAEEPALREALAMLEGRPGSLYRPPARPRRWVRRVR